jgi:hypothetical protein
MGETTTIPVTKGTRDRLKTIGQKGETYDEIIHRLIEIAEQVDFFNKQKRILEEEGFVPLDQV